MDTARWEKVSELLSEALALEPGEREAFLQREAGSDAELLRSVRELLAAEHDSTGFLEPLAASDLSRLARPEDELLGARLGPFLLERELGAGGMGSVFLASRADGAFEQRVALKLVRRGMDTDRILERFRNERQVLAGLEHPGIARLVDGGAAPDGRPWLAMEFVEGDRIDRWCASRGLERRQRLELFLAVCDAVQHAHSRRVVHRDLKPANILVAHDGRPRLLDFGLAKLLAPGGRAETYDLTAEGQRLMTPHYASPEQIRGERVTVATDVYALGVVLHELLTGRRPFDLEGLSWAEVQHEVCERDIAATGLPLDLHTIVAVALRKEPERRYASVEALAADLRRYLEGLPIAARPATASYLVRRFVRRNRALVGTTLAVFAVLVGAVVAVSRQAGIASTKAREAEAALKRAREALDDAEAVNAFLGDVLLASSARRLGRDVTVREALDAAASQVDASVRDRPWVEAGVRRTLGGAYLNLGALAAAVPQLERAAELSAREHGPHAPRTLATRLELARALRDRGDGAEAARTVDELLASWRSTGAAARREEVETVELAGLLAWELGDLELAATRLGEALERWTAVLPEDPAAELVTRKHLATLKAVMGDAVGSVALLREVLEAQTTLLGAEHADTLITTVDLATALRSQGGYEEAEALYRQALEVLDRSLPDGHLDRLITGMQLCFLLSFQGRHAEVIDTCGPLLDRASAALGEDHAVTDGLRTDMARALAAEGLFEEALEIGRRSVASARRVHGPDGARTREAEGEVAGWEARL